MHISGSIPKVNLVLHAEDALIGLSELDVEPESDKRLFAFFVFPGLPVFSLLNDGTLILLEDSVPRMRIASTQSTNTPWQTFARFQYTAESCKKHSPTASRSGAIHDLCQLLESKVELKRLPLHTA